MKNFKVAFRPKRGLCVLARKRFLFCFSRWIVACTHQRSYRVALALAERLESYRKMELVQLCEKEEPGVVRPPKS